MAKTKEKGDLGHMKCVADLMQKGYKILFPFGEDWKFDIVVYSEGKFLRVQCKYDNGKIDGVVRVKCRSTNNWTNYKYTNRDIDFIAVYHEPTKSCYYVPANLLGDKGRSSIYLRIKPVKNNQQTGVLLAKNFTEIMPE